MTRIIQPPYIASSYYLPSICRRRKCFKDTMRGSEYCSEHHPKERAFRHTTKEYVRPKSGVYFVGFGDSVKIGRSDDIYGRFNSLKTSSPHELVLLAYVEFSDPARWEKVLHDVCKPCRTKGEWFMNKGIVSDVVELAKTSESPIKFLTSICEIYKLSLEQRAAMLKEAA